MPSSGSRNPGAILAIALATPAALGLETLARTLLLPSSLAQLRHELNPLLTPLAWGILALTVLAVPAGFATHRALARRFSARALSLGASEKKLAEARFEALFVGTSVPQIPAIFSTFVLTAGADALPVLLAVGASALAVVVIAVFPLRTAAGGE